MGTTNKSTMEKSTIIIGPRESGKTSLAKKIALQYKADEVVWVSGQSIRDYQHPYVYSRCTENTKLVIFDEMTDTCPRLGHKSMELSNVVAHFFNDVSNGVTVNQRLKDPYMIHPRIVLIIRSEVYDDLDLLQDESIRRRFDVHHMQKKPDGYELSNKDTSAMKKRDRHFIKVTATYTSKNKLQKLLLEVLGQLDCSLCESRELANMAIKQEFETCLEQYKKDGGKAATPDFHKFDFTGYDQVRVGGFIVFAIYPVKQILIGKNVTV